MKEATGNYYFCYCSSSQTIRLDLVGCGKLGRDFEKTVTMISRDFVEVAVVAVVEAMKASFETFVVVAAAVIGEVAALEAVLRSFDDNQSEASQNSLNVFDLLVPRVWLEASLVVMITTKKRQAADSNSISVCVQWDAASL